MIPDTMPDVLATQRTAFTAELPVPLEIRRDRLRRLIAMVADNAERFATALCQDFAHRSREQSMLTDIVGSVGPAKHALAHMHRWVRPEKRRLQFPLGLFGARAWTSELTPIVTALFEEIAPRYFDRGIDFLRWWTRCQTVRRTAWVTSACWAMRDGDRPS